MKNVKCQIYHRRKAKLKCTVDANATNCELWSLTLTSYELLSFLLCKSVLYVYIYSYYCQLQFTVAICESVPPAATARSINF